MAQSGDRFGLPINFVECKKCGLIRLEPFPTEAFLNAFYARGWYHGLYLRKKKLSGAQLEIQRGKQRINIDCLRSLNLPETFSLLDFGTGNGSLIEAVRQAFPHAQTRGIEPNESYYKAESGKNNYDVITMIHVLEHLYDPIETLRALRNLLSPTGHLIVEVPDADTYSAWGMKPWHIAHTLHFNKKNLEQALGKAGFRVERWHEPSHAYGIRAIAVRELAENYFFKSFAKNDVISSN